MGAGKHGTGSNACSTLMTGNRASPSAANAGVWRLQMTMGAANVTTCELWHASDGLPPMIECAAHKSAPLASPYHLALVCLECTAHAPSCAYYSMHHRITSHLVCTKVPPRPTGRAYTGPERQDSPRPLGA